MIIVAPLITTQPQGGPVTEGDNVTLSCNASGNPVPTITWTRNGSVLTSSVPRISFGAESRELTITTINKADSGEYRCVANNSEGNVTSNAATLDVQCKYTSCLFQYDMTGKTSASGVTTLYLVTRLTSMVLTLLFVISYCNNYCLITLTAQGKDTITYLREQNYYKFPCLRNCKFT